jgi:hypothetical protein
MAHFIKRGTGNALCKESPTVAILETSIAFLNFNLISTLYVDVSSISLEVLH